MSAPDHRRRAAAAALSVLVLAGCTSAADRANDNLSKAAENFEVPRRITGVNGITDEVLFTVEGFCSIENDGRKLDVICRVDEAGSVERTTLGLSDNVTYVSTQTGSTKVDRGRGAERRLTTADWARERGAEAAHARDQPIVHGTASGYAGCAQPGARRCDLCRAYQRERVQRSRADRLYRALCSGTRSSYDAGCRCTSCTTANSSGCARWRARRDDVLGVAA